MSCLQTHQHYFPCSFPVPSKRDSPLSWETTLTMCTMVYYAAHTMLPILELFFFFGQVFKCIKSLNRKLHPQLSSQHFIISLIFFMKVEFGSFFFLLAYGNIFNCSSSSPLNDFVLLHPHCFISCITACPLITIANGKCLKVGFVLRAARSALN